LRTTLTLCVDAIASTSVPSSIHARAVQRPRSGPGMGAFEERVVEVRETSEEPVVLMTAHVVEEVVSGREATERKETVEDTVRREEVEITNDAGVKR
jgi:hypothetical protein